MRLQGSAAKFSTKGRLVQVVFFAGIDHRMKRRDGASRTQHSMIKEWQRRAWPIMEKLGQRQIGIVYVGALHMSLLHHLQSAPSHDA